MSLLYGSYFHIRAIITQRIGDTAVACEIYLFLLDLGELVDVFVRVDPAGPVVDDNGRNEKRDTGLGACGTDRTFRSTKSPVWTNWDACRHNFCKMSENKNGSISE